MHYPFSIIHGTHCTFKWRKMLYDSLIEAQYHQSLTFIEYFKLKNKPMKVKKHRDKCDMILDRYAEELI